MLNAAAARRGIPLGAKIAALQQPSAGMMGDANIRFGIGAFGSGELNVEIEFAAGFMAYKSGIAILQQLDEIRVDRVHLTGTPPIAITMLWVSTCAVNPGTEHRFVTEGLPCAIQMDKGACCERGTPDNLSRPNYRPRSTRVELQPASPPELDTNPAK